MSDEPVDGRDLDRFWNDLVAGRGGDRGYALASDTGETVRAFQAMAKLPPTEASRDRVDAAIFAAIERAAAGGRASDALVLLAGPDPAFAANGAGHPVPLRTLPNKKPGWRRVSGAALATAALALLVLVSSIVIMTPRQPGEHEPAAILVAPASGPVAEFLWQATGEPDARLIHPAGVGIDPQGNVWVTDANKGHFVIFSPEGDVLETFGTLGAGEGEFDFRCGAGYGGVDFDAAGNIYVADAGNGRIQKFGPDRGFLTNWPVQGVVDSQLLVTGRGNQPNPNGPRSCPTAVAVDGLGRVVVGDREGLNIKVFDAQGSLLATATTESMRPEGVAVDGENNIWVADTHGRVLMFSPDGQLLATWDDVGVGDGQLMVPMGIAVDTQNRVFVSDQAARVQVFSPDGAFLGAWGSAGAKPGKFIGPVAVAVDGAGHAYVVDHGLNWVQKFRLLPPIGPD